METSEQVHKDTATLVVKAKIDTYTQQQHNKKKLDSIKRGLVKGLYHSDSIKKFLKRRGFLKLIMSVFNCWNMTTKLKRCNRPNDINMENTHDL